MYSIRELQRFLFLFSDKRYTGLVSLSDSRPVRLHREREKGIERDNKNGERDGKSNMKIDRHH